MLVQNNQQMLMAKRIQDICQKGINFALSKAESDLSAKQYNNVAEWVYFATTIAWCIYPGYFYSKKIDHILGVIAESLPNNHKINEFPADKSSQAISNLRCLHVISVASRTGGHTRVLARWIENSIKYLPQQIHSICFTQQGKTDIPEWLLKLVDKNTGEIIIIPDKLPILDKACALQEVSAKYDVIVLHIHPNDIISNIAFANHPYTKTILFFNHADHVFSVGMSISDIVLDFRSSGQQITLNERNSNNNMILPIPLLDNPPLDNEQADSKTQIRNLLGIDLNDRIILTVGDEYKYRPALGYNFQECVRKILQTDKSIYVYAVGISDKGEWGTFIKESGGRFKALGRIENRSLLQKYYMAADIYMEGFPFSSITAMLEAGLNRLPIQRMQNIQVPILSGDDIALDGLVSIATNEDEYAMGVIALLNLSNEQRYELGQKIQTSIINVHSGKQWVKNYLEPVFEIAIDKHTHKEKNEASSYLSQINSLSLTLIQWTNKGTVSMAMSSVINSSVSAVSVFSRGMQILMHLKQVLPLKVKLKIIVYILTVCMIKLIPNQAYKKIRLMIAKK